MMDVRKRDLRSLLFIKSKISCINLHLPTLGDDEGVVYEDDSDDENYIWVGQGNWVGAIVFRSISYTIVSD